MPPRYRVVEHVCGAVAYLGEGTPSPDAKPAHAPQVLKNDECLVVLVSPDLAAKAVVEAFKAACYAQEEPRARAVALKHTLRDMSSNYRFSFVLVDLNTARVWAASTAMSSPVATGHAADGTLLVTCTRSGARAATAWPPQWAQPPMGHRSSPTQSTDRHAGNSSNRTNAWVDVTKPNRHKKTPSFGQSPPSKFGMSSFEHVSNMPVTPEREARPTSPTGTERSRSRSPGASSTHSTGTEASEARSEAAYLGSVTTKLQHLPAGRFVYGRRHLQPFEFSAFWGSAESTRAGARATSSPNADEKPGGGVGDARRGRDSPPQDNILQTGRARFSDTGSQGDAVSSWRKKPPVSPASVPSGSSPGNRGDGQREEKRNAWSRVKTNDATPSPSGNVKSPTPPSFRAMLARSNSAEDSAGSPTCGGLTRAFASSVL